MAKRTSNGHAGNLTNVGDTPVVVPCVQHHQVHQLAHLEGPPDAEAVVHVDLTIWPLVYYTLLGRC